MEHYAAKFSGSGDKDNTYHLSAPDRKSAIDEAFETFPDSRSMTRIVEYACWCESKFEDHDCGCGRAGNAEFVAEYFPNIDCWSDENK